MPNRNTLGKNGFIESNWVRAKWVAVKHFCPRGQASNPSLPPCGQTWFFGNPPPPALSTWFMINPYSHIRNLVLSKTMKNEIRHSHAQA